MRIVINQSSSDLGLVPCKCQCPYNDVLITLRSSTPELLEKRFLDSRTPILVAIPIITRHGISRLMPVFRCTGVAGAGLANGRIVTAIPFLLQRFARRCYREAPHPRGANLFYPNRPLHHIYSRRFEILALLIQTQTI